MLNFENKNNMQAQIPEQTTHLDFTEELDLEAESETSNLFGNILKYIFKFIKAPISTMENAELGSKEAAIILAVFPVTMFLAIWSLIRSLVNSMINAAIQISGLVETRTTQIRLRAFAEVSWGRIFFNGILIIAVWIALMVLVPYMLAKISKNPQPIDLKKLFSQIAVITIPMTLLQIIATIFGFISFGLWFIPITVSLLISLLLHFVAIRKTFNESPDKTLYIIFITHVIIVVIVGLWMNALTDNMLMNIMADILWN